MTIISDDLPYPAILDFAKYQEWYKPNFSDKDKVEKDLFEFSNRIGSFITFFIMYAMDLKNHNMAASSDEHKEIIIRMARAGVSKIIPEIIFKLALLFNEKEVKENQLPSGRVAIQETPKFVFKEEYRKETYDAFTRLCPGITYELEKSSDIRYSFNEELKNIISKVK